jgi:hypothetical protein
MVLNLKGLEAVDHNKYFDVSEAITRRHKVKLVKKGFGYIVMSFHM